MEDSVEPGVNMVIPCNEIQKTAWEVLKHFNHALILREDDPLLPAILGVYEAQGLRNGAPTNRMKGSAFQTEPDTAYPDCRLVVTKETMTVEVVYELLKDKLNIAKLTFTGGVNAASQEYSTAKTVERCPLCVWRSMKTAYARHAAIRRHNRRAQRSLHKRRAAELRVFLSENTRSRAAGVCPAQPIKKGHLAVAFDGRLHKRQTGNESRRHPPIGRN